MRQSLQKDAPRRQELRGENGPHAVAKSLDQYSFLISTRHAPTVQLYTSAGELPSETLPSVSLDPAPGDAGRERCAVKASFLTSLTGGLQQGLDRKSTRLNSSHSQIS